MAQCVIQCTISRGEHLGFARVRGVWVGDAFVAERRALLSVRGICQCLSMYLVAFMFDIWKDPSPSRAGTLCWEHRVSQL